MKTTTTKPILTALAAFVFTLLPISAQEMPKPTKEHQWLNQFLGDWELKTQIFMEPGKPPVEATMAEKVKSIGGFWVVSDAQGEMMGGPFQGAMTIGYDTEKKKYVGVWIDSMTSQIWHSEGSVDEAGKSLTLTSRGFCPVKGKVCNFKETIVFQDATHRTFTSMVQDEKGEWEVAMKGSAVRK